MRTENKLIAEFMGYKVMEEEKFLTYDYPKGTDLTKIMVDVAMKYHTSWDWLMPVVEKIGYLAHNYGDGEIVDYFQGEPTFDIWFSGYGNICINTDISGVYETLVGFIKWYNDQNICKNCGYSMGIGYANCDMSEDGTCPKCGTEQK